MTDYYTQLGVARTATAAEIRTAYAKIAREKHPDRFTDPKERAEAHAMFQEATTAFNALSNPGRRQDYDASLDRKPPTPEEIARNAFERAVHEYEAKHFHEALELLRTAVQHAPDEARYHAALGKTLARNPHWVREGIQEIERATQLAPRIGSYQADLAEVLLAQGLKLRARKAAEAALRFAPDDPRALKVWDQTAPEPTDQPPPESGGGLRGLLRRKP
jgi:tetratricopeptide (TPR) repeat protein